MKLEAWYSENNVELWSSAVGLYVTKLRTRLSDKNIDSLFFLRKNLPSKNRLFKWVRYVLFSEYVTRTDQ